MEGEVSGEFVRRLLEAAESYMGMDGDRADLLRGLMTGFQEDRLRIEELPKE